MRVSCRASGVIGGVDKAPVLALVLGDAYTKQQQHYAKRRKAAVNEGGAFSGDDGDGGGIDDGDSSRGDELKDTAFIGTLLSKAVVSSRDLCSEESRSRIESLSEDDLARFYGSRLVCKKSKTTRGSTERRRPRRRLIPCPPSAVVE